MTAAQEPTILYLNRESPLYEDIEDILERKESNQLRFYTHEEIWKEHMSEFYKVAKVDEVPEGTKKLVEVDFVPVLLFNVDGEFYAMEDVCTHDGGPLGEGFLDGDEIECPRHGARFCVKTGKALCMPAVEDIECFPVKIEDDEILVNID